jgi:hypothetical protein
MANSAPPNLVSSPYGRCAEPVAAAQAADATAKAYGLRFGPNHPGSLWAQRVANEGRAILGVPR